MKRLIVFPVQASAHSRLVWVRSRLGLGFKVGLIATKSIPQLMKFAVRIFSFSDLCSVLKATAAEKLLLKIL